MRTVLFLYTEPPTRRVLARRRPPGRLVLASDALTAEDAAVYDACVPLPPPWALDETLRVLRRLEADLLVVQHEYALLAGSLLARERGLPGPSPEAAHLCTNKWLGRHALGAAGLKVPAFALATTAAEVRRRARRDPVVLKPVASTMARHVAVVASPRGVEDAVARLRAQLPLAPDVRRLVAFARLARVDPGCDPTRAFLVEEWAEGEAVETDGIVLDGRVDGFGATPCPATVAPTAGSTTAPRGGAPCSGHHPPPPPGRGRRGLLRGRRLDRATAPTGGHLSDSTVVSRGNGRVHRHDPRVWAREISRAYRGRTKTPMPLGSYALLTSGYVAGSAGMLAAARERLPRRIAARDLVLLGVATHKLSRLLTRDWVTSPLRAPFTVHAKDDVAGDVEDRSRGRGLRRALGDLLTCPWCTGAWLAAAFTFALVMRPREARLLASILAVEALSDVLHLAYDAAKKPAEG